MKAIVLEAGRLAVAEMPAPTPTSGQILARPLVCGVCGSDLHARDHSVHLCTLLNRAGFRGFMDPGLPVVMGHEFCAEVLEQSDPKGFARGQRIVALPFIEGANGVELIGYSNCFNGAFAEQMLLDAELAFAVPDHVETPVAALTEPLAVAVHAVAESGADGDSVLAVHGCGPVGQFVLARLRALGLGPVMAVDPSPARRRMAARMGADLVIAPDAEAQARWWRGHGLFVGLSDSQAAAGSRRPIVFECVGKPGMLAAIAEQSPVHTVVTVVGNCMEPDHIEPALLLQKSIQLRFVFAYSADEFAQAFAMICASPERLQPMITGIVGFDAVDAAFDALMAGGEQVKMLVAPGGPGDMGQAGGGT